MEQHVIAILDDIARKTVALVREGNSPDHDSPHWRALDAISQLYPSTYKKWQDGGR